MKVGIVGSRKYQAPSKIRKFIYELKKKFGDELEIVSGDQPKGADGYAKKFALEFEVKYVAFPPAHYNWNSYCIKEAHNYGKDYRPYYFFQRNTEIAEYSDVVVAFIPRGTKIEESKGTHDTIKKADKLGKRTLVLW